MAVKVYDPDQVVIMFASLPIKGFADGTFLVVEPAGEAFTSKTGADGEVVRVKTSNKLTRVRFTLMQTSDSNDVLSAIHNLDLNSSNGAGVAPLGIKDLSGRFVLIAAEAWIVQAPNAEFGREAGNREWILECADAERFDGGN